MALKDLAPPVRPKATLVYSPHPLLVDAGRVVQQTVAIRGESIGDYLRRHGIDTDKPLVVSVDGKPVARDEWELLDAEEGMLVAARGALAGGDGGSNVVAMVATIALAVFAPYLSGVLVSQVGGIGLAATLGSTGLAVVTAATTGVITLAGSMLINKLFPPPKMDLGKGLGALQASANYSISGGQNRARPFEPLALTLGTHRVFFDLAGRPYSTYQGEDQYLYQVFCVGLVGPHGAYDVSDLRIGTTLLSTYEGVTTETSIGTMPAMMPANVDTVAGASITEAAPQAVRTTSPNTTKIELDFTAMSFRARSSGKIEGALLDWTIEYCPTGTGTWQTLEYVSTYGNGQKPIRLSRSYAVDSGTYDVRVTGHTLSTSSKFVRQLTWDAVKCYQPDDGYYEGQQFLAVKIKATGQLNGVIDRLNGIVRMPTAPGVYSSNPADLLTLFAVGHKAADGRPLWGGQLSSSALDVAGIDAWRTWCTAKGLTFNAVVDAQRSVWDILQSITRCGRGSPTWAPGKLGVVWDADNQPVVASFNMANIKRGTFEVAYQSEAPVDEVVLTYVNAADDYAADTVRAIAPGVTSPAKSATIELWGCTNQAMAVKECHLALAENLYRTRLVSWETDMEGLVVTRGDVVSLSHDLTQWGKSGRLVSGTTTALVLDQAITLESAGTWIGIIAPDGTQYTCRVAYQAGDHSSITLLDPLPIAPDADNPIDWRYTADYVATPGKLVKIVSIVPAGMDSVKLTAVDEYDEYYAAENGTYTPPTKREWASNQPQIRSLGVTEEIVKSGGSHTTKIIISWSEAGNVASRLVRYSIDGGPLEIAGHANGSRFELIVPDAGTVMIVVTLYDGLGQTSSGAQASVTHTLQGLAYAPFELAGFTAVGELFQNRLSWVFQGDLNDVKHVEVWGGITNNRAAATLLTTMAAPSNGWLHTGLATGQTWFYWARVIDHKLRPSDYLPLSETAGTSATTSSNPSEILAALNNSITETALVQALKDKIQQGVDANTAVVSQDTRIDGLEAQYTVKIQANGYVAGYGLATSAPNGVPTSEFIVLADKFAVASPTVAAKYPFVVGTVNGSSAVGIDGTLVVDGSIVANKIDTRGLTVKDAAGNVILSSGVPLDWARVGGTGKPQDGATVGANSSNLAAGIGANLLSNGSFKSDSIGWVLNSSTENPASILWRQPGLEGAPAPYGSLLLSSTGTADGVFRSSVSSYNDRIPCVPGQRIEAQAHVQVFRGSARLEVGFFDATSTYLGGIVVTNGVSTANENAVWTNNLVDFVRLWGFVTAPANAATAMVEVRSARTSTAAGTDLYVAMAYLGHASSGQIEPSLWVDGTPRGAFSNLDQITPSNASTYIANAAIGQLQVDLASANRLIVGQANIDNLAVNTLQLAGNAVTTPVSGEFAGTSGGPVNTTYMERTVTLGSITTDPYGRGQVVVLVGNAGLQGSADTASSGGIMEIRQRIIRNGVVIKDWVTNQSIGAGGMLSSTRTLSQFLDTPGAGVTATYQLQVTTYSQATATHNIVIGGTTYTMIEFKR